MPRVDELFRIHRGRSELFDRYAPGPVAYVSNLSEANGVLGQVTPRPGDTVFEYPAIVLNSFSRLPQSCGARVMQPPFIASSRSGNGLLVLEPLELMSVDLLGRMAAYINLAHGWRFTWYRQVTRDRVAPLMLPGPDFAWPTICAVPQLPDRQPRQHLPPLSAHRKFLLSELFSLRAGGYHAVSHLKPGAVPIISCADEHNGVIGRYAVPEDHRHRDCLTIAFNGRPLTTKYHPYEFAAKDDVAVATPRRPMALTTLLYVKMALEDRKSVV